MKAKAIKPVKDFGVTGFQVTFSISDLYKMNMLADDIYRIHDELTKDGACYDSLRHVGHLFSELFRNTVNAWGSDWDCLQTDEEPCTK